MRRARYRLKPVSFCLIAGFLALTALVPPAGAEGIDEPYPIGRVLTPETAARKDAPDVVRMQVSHFSQPNQNDAIIMPTVRAFQKAFGRDHFYAEVFSGERINPKKTDLVLSSAGTYRRAADVGSRDIGSLVSDRFPDPNHAEGSVFVVRKGNRTYQSLKDLKGLRLVTSGPKAFTGYQVAMGELLREGINPDRFFSDQIVKLNDMPSVVTALRKGEADVGVLRTCFLEDMAAEGKDISDLAVVGAKPETKDFRCVRSTALYPNWTVTITPHATPDVARLAASTLLSMKPIPGNLHWGMATDFTPVDTLFKELKIGPYEYLRHWTLRRFLSEYWPFLTLFIAAVIGLLLHSVRSDRLVERRTRELTKAYAKQKELEERTRRANEHLAALQKNGMIRQMSSMVVHELRQPLATIVNYVQSLLRLSDMHRPNSEAMMQKGLTTIRSEALKADEIVTKVRDYAKRSSGSDTRTVIDLTELVNRSVANLEDSSRYRTPIHSDIRPGCLIEGDRLEIEVAVVNLIKNALEAADRKGGSDARVSVVLDRFETADGESIRLTIENTGDVLTKERLESLGYATKSAKPEGLGLGLAIVRTIIQNHSGSIAFNPREAGGLAVTVTIPAPSHPIS